MEDQILPPSRLSCDEDTRNALTTVGQCVTLFVEIRTYKPGWLEGQSTQFNTWVFNLSTSDNHYVLSQLRSNPQFLKTVTQHLNMLKTSFLQINESFSKPLQRQIQERETGDIVVSKSPSVEDPLHYIAPSLTGIESKELDLKTAEDTLSSLNTLLAAKVSTTDRHDRFKDCSSAAQIHISGDFKQCAFKMVQEEMPEAKTFMKDRLVISLEHRRKRLLNGRQNNNTPQSSDKDVIDLELPKEPKLAQQDLASQDVDSESVEMPGTGSTTAESKTTTESETSSVEQKEYVRWKNIEGFPAPPDLSPKQSYFVCSVCQELTPAKEAKGDLWIQHILQDLHPYICILEHCRSPNINYTSFEAWQRHIREEKVAAEAFIPNSSGKISTHLASKDFISCPLCPYKLNTDEIGGSLAIGKQETVQEHIANHLHSLALTSLSHLHFYNQPDPPESIAPGPFGSVHETAIKFHESEVSIHSIQRQIPIQEHVGYSYIPPQRPQERIIYSPAEIVRTELKPQSEEFESYDVLLAEDNLINQKIISKVLAKHHHLVTMTNHGQEALDVFKQGRYDIILMDIVMPVMDGFEATKRIREYEQRMGRERTPIIGLLVNAVNDSKEKALNAGMDDYIYKPVRFTQLGDLILKYGRLGRLAIMNEELRVEAEANARIRIKPTIRSKI